MIARRAGLDAARPGKVSRDRPPDRAGAGRTAEQHRIVHRLERELLVARRHQRFDFGNRRAGLGGQHEFLRLVQRDAGKRRKIERGVPLRGAADGALAAMADDFECLAIAERPLDRLLDLFGIARFQIVGHRARHHSAASAAGVERAKAGMISRAKARNCSRPPEIVSRT